MATRGARGFGQYGGAARALERVGDRWALLIVRDLLVGPRRYGDLKASLPRIPTNILSDRLKELQEAGVLRRVPAVRGGYELTALGRGLEPVVLALERWGWSVLGEPGFGEAVGADALAVSLRAAFRPDAAASLPPTEYVLHVGDVSLSAIVVGGTLDIVPIGAGALPQPRRRSAFEPVPEAVLEIELATAALHGLLSGDPGGVAVLAGGADLLERFEKTFRIEPVTPSTDTASGAEAAA
ncbi:winged helix-turn-helix transcriptional regulator [Agromyces badenianii]|uniref:winged helix-turn-helix transcriptional regulator n=1 Tax=Agromyces badenianii TaxID=2080742 RepID=UPI000D59025C|nr:helix-turn-helix domain-containing protein [Agromyces badenianii]PWC03602.1 transcriptional regulator [Agromyces badenianii]